jgi:hypothetical protein
LLFIHVKILTSIFLTTYAFQQEAASVFNKGRAALSGKVGGMKVQKIHQSS